MQVLINKKFLQDLAILPVKERHRVEKFLFEEVPTFRRISEIPNIIKLKGYKNYYRIRFGAYRAGLKFDGNILTFERLVHRKDIYKYYP